MLSREHVGVQGFIPPVRQQEFERTVGEAVSMFKLPDAPAMPVIQADTPGLVACTCSSSHPNLHSKEDSQGSESLDG